MAEGVLYAASWAGDPALGEAIVTVLCDELQRRGFRFRVEQGPAPTDMFDFVEEFEGVERWGLFRSVLVDQELLQAGGEVLDYVLAHRGGDLIRHAVEISKARGYLQSEEEVREYIRGLKEDYGFSDTSP